MDVQPMTPKLIFCALFGISLIQCGEASSGEGGGGGALAGGAAPAAGAPGAGGGGGEPCAPLICEDFNESTCESSSADCNVIYGTLAGGSGELEYAGCGARLRHECEGAQDAEVCAHPESSPGECWTLPSGALPDGWLVLSTVQDCSDFPQCSSGD